MFSHKLDESNLKPTLVALSPLRPKGRFALSTSLSLLPPYIQYNTHMTEPHRSLVKTSDLQNAVKLPEGGCKQHWIATHTKDFYKMTHVLFGSITEFCTDKTCPVMSCGRRYEYLWKDKREFRKVTRVSAPQYVELFMAWAEEMMGDEEAFPTTEGVQYPKDFIKNVSNIFKRLFRVYAHVYYSHFFRVQFLDEEAHLNTAFKHLVLFGLEFKLLEPSEMAPIRDLVEGLIGADVIKQAIADNEEGAND